MADNPYYHDPYLAKIASNLVGLFVDKNPGQTMVQREHAGYYRSQNEKLASEVRGRSKIASVLRTRPQDATELSALGMEHGIPYAQGSGYYLLNRATDPDATTPQIQGASIGAGQASTPNSVYSTADRELVADRNARNDKARSDSSAGIAAGASRANNRDTIAFHERTRFDAPVDYAPGHGKSFNPADTRAPAGHKPGDVSVPVAAKPGADKFVQSQDETGKPVWRQAAEGIPGPVAKPGAVNDVNPNESADMEFHSLRDLGALTSDGKSVDPEFRKMYGPKMEGAKIAASAVYQTTRDAARAQKAYREALGIEPGATFKPRGTPIIGSGPAAMVPPAGAAPPAAAGPPPAPLTPTDRKPNTVYSTPKGPMTWTGTGWLPATQ